MCIHYTTNQSVHLGKTKMTRRISSLLEPQIAQNLFHLSRQLVIFIPCLGRYLFHQKKRPTSSNPTSSISPNNFFPKSSTLIIAYLIPPPHNQRTHARSQQQRKSEKIEFLHALGRRRRRRNEERKQQDPPNLKNGADIRSFPRLRTAIQNQHSPDRQSAQISHEGFEERVRTQGVTAIQL